MYGLCPYFMPWFFPFFSQWTCSRPCHVSHLPEARPTVKVSSLSNFLWHPLPLNLSRAFTWQKAEGFLILIEEGSISNNMEGNYGLYCWCNFFFWSILRAKLWQKIQLDCWLLTLNNGFSFFFFEWDESCLNWNNQGKECSRDSVAFSILIVFFFSF